VSHSALQFPAPPPRNFLKGFPEGLLPRPSVRGQRWKLAGHVSADFLAVGLDFVAVGYLAALAECAVHANPSLLLHPLAFPKSAWGFLLLYGALFTLMGYSERLYQPEMVRSPRQERWVLGKTMFWSTLLVVAAMSAEGHLISIGVLAASAPVNFLIMLGWRNLRRRIAEKRAQHGLDMRHVLMIGAGPVGRRIAAHFGNDTVDKRLILGFLDDDEPIEGDVRGRIGDLAHIARTEFVDEIILTAPQQLDIAQTVIAEARHHHIDVKVIPDLFGAEPESVLFERFGNLPVLTLRQERIPCVGLSVKRAADTLVSGIGLIMASPLLAAIALAIRLDSPGPIFYQAARVGLKGRRFRCCKFRTMVGDADCLKEHLRTRNERQGPCFKITDDPRITRVGRLLRRYSLDELPQLWNVLKGEMSMVGPRPHPLDDFEQYELEDLQRLEVTPGLTGLWQVTARRDPSFRRNMALDLEYIEGWNFWTDLWILCKTVSVVLQGTGA